MTKKYWLMKSEPSVFSVDDFNSAKDQTTHWDGVRNYQARNFLRDSMKKGDLVLFYHSNSNPAGVTGICEVVKEGYPDFTAFDPDSNHFDPSGNMDNPTWYMVDVKLVRKFPQMVTLDSIKANPKLSEMILVRKGNRLSVFPVTEDDFNEIVAMSGIK